MAKKSSTSSTASAGLTPEHILTGYTPEVRELCDALRSLVRAAAPEASETAYPSWHGIGYRHPKSGYFCAIFPQTDYVKLGFEFGVLLPDPDRHEFPKAPGRAGPPGDSPGLPDYEAATRP